MERSFFELAKTPFEQFERLLKEAEEGGIFDPTAMSLATVDSDNKPSIRIVYMKETIREGFVFYGNYNSHKCQDIEKNPNVCLNFFWAQQFRQVRIIGKAEKTSREVSEKYFATRPRISQIGAWVSDQSAPLESADLFNVRYNEYEKKFEGQDVPCPPHWGGTRVEPEYYEFWFGRAGRLHDRFIYEKTSKGWKTYLKNP